jgi:divalent metal cation (Fe/Co/Zn/Cd) transporter
VIFFERWNNSRMGSVPHIRTQEAVSRIQRLQAITVGWMVVETGVSLWAAWNARSPALLAFGGDSAIELLSAVIVLWRFRTASEHHRAERAASRISGGLLLLLAAYVVGTSILALLGHSESQPTYIGIAVLIVAAVVMPWLAREKRRLSAETRSAALRADSAQSAVCAYLSLLALLGVGMNAIWHVRWADPAAALLAIPLILREGWEAIRGKLCSCQ